MAVIYGANGDLTKRKLVPALYRLAYERRLPPGFAVIGISRTKLTDDEFRAKMRESVQRFLEDSPFDEGLWDEFARGLFYEAHDVLEELWLVDRRGADGDFFKGLIQFAGAFVHLQKHTPARPRLRPSAALFKLAQGNLQRYPARHWRLDLRALLLEIDHWLQRLDHGRFEVNPLGPHPPPRIEPGAD